MSVRESFVQHFGEEQAVKIEEASINHHGSSEIDYKMMLSMVAPEDPELASRLEDSGHPHKDDDWGEDPFQYHFLTAVGYQCMEDPHYREYHGITVPLDEVKAWARAYGRLDEFRGDVPDYLALVLGAYNDWMPQSTNIEKES